MRTLLYVLRLFNFQQQTNPVSVKLSASGLWSNVEMLQT